MKKKKKPSVFKSRHAAAASTNPAWYRPGGVPTNTAGSRPRPPGQEAPPPHHQPVKMSRKSWRSSACRKRRVSSSPQHMGSPSCAAKACDTLFSGVRGSSSEPESPTSGRLRLAMLNPSQGTERQEEQQEEQQRRGSTLWLGSWSCAGSRESVH